MATSPAAVATAAVAVAVTAAAAAAAAILTRRLFFSGKSTSPPGWGDKPGGFRLRLDEGFVSGVYGDGEPGEPLKGTFKNARKNGLQPFREF